MPKAYEAMRDKFAKTMPEKAAKTKAAKIFNANRKPNQRPVTNKGDK
jgi:hypothetical protein